jgi:Domain of unknown function (DUF4326)
VKALEKGARGTKWVFVGRGTKWANPFINCGPRLATLTFQDFIQKQGAWSPMPTAEWPKGKIPTQWTTVEEVKAELRGKDLVCTCPLDQPCHADVLLKIANE